MSEFLTKIAEESDVLAELLYKAASDEVASYTEDEVMELLSAALESDEVDQNAPEVQEELAKKAESGELEEYLILKVAELAAEDVYTNFDQEKIASADQGFETAAASKAVGQFLEMNGAAILGPTNGTAPNYFGSVIHSGVDKNVFGGYGKQIITSILKPEAAQAGNKISQLLSATNMNIIKSAEAENEERLVEFVELLEKSAAEAGQTPDEFVYGIGKDEIEDYIRENVSLTEMHRAEKTASDLTLDYIEKRASELEIDEDRFVVAVGIEKAASELDGVIAEKLAEAEKEAAIGLGKSTAYGAGIGALLGGGAGAWKSRNEDGKEKLKSILKGVAGGGAAGAGLGAASAIGRQGSALAGKGSSLKDKIQGSGRVAKMHAEGAYNSAKKSVGEGAEKVKGLFKKKEKPSDTVLKLAQERLYGTNA